MDTQLLVFILQWRLLPMNEIKTMEMTLEIKEKIGMEIQEMTAQEKKEYFNKRSEKFSKYRKNAINLKAAI